MIFVSILASSCEIWQKLQMKNLIANSLSKCLFIKISDELTVTGPSVASYWYHKTYSDRLWQNNVKFGVYAGFDALLDQRRTRPIL